MIPEAASTSSFIHPLILHSKTKRSLNVYYIAGTRDTTLLKTNKGNLCPPWGFLLAPVEKNLSTNAGDVGTIPGSGRLPGERNGNPRQCSCLENSTDRGAWWAAVHGVAQSQTRLSNFTTTTT